MSARDITEMIELTDDVEELQRSSSTTLNLSFRSYHRVVTVAQTICDLAGEQTIKPELVFEALQYRVKV